MFRTWNQVTGSMYRPVWPVMQLGSLGRLIAVAAVVRLARRRKTALGVVGGGAFIWLFCRLVKRSIGRGRPEMHLDAATVVVNWSRLYVGAHLPLDVIGGVGRGVATGAATNFVLERLK